MSISPDLLENFFRYVPYGCALYQKRVQGSRVSLYFIRSNEKLRELAPRSGVRIPEGTEMSSVEPLVFSNQKLMAAVNEAEIGKSVRFIFHSFLNSKYKGGVFHGTMIPLPNDYVLNVTLPLNYQYIREMESFLDQSCKSENGDIQKDIFLISSRLSSIQDVQSSGLPSTFSVIKEPDPGPAVRLPTVNIPHPLHQPSINIHLGSPSALQSVPLGDPFACLNYAPKSHNLPSHGLTDETFRRAFYESPFGLVILSLKGEYLAMNNAQARMLGYTVDELLNKTFALCTHPDDMEKSVGLLRQMVGGEIDSFQMPKRYIHKQGHSVWTLLTTAIMRDQTGRRTGFISASQSISHLQSLLMTVDLKRDDELFKQAFTKNPLPVCIVTNHGEVWNANRAFWEILGHSGQDIGKPFSDFFLPDDQTIVRDAIQRIVEGRISAFQMLARAAGANGNAFLSLLSFSIITDANGVITHATCSLLSTTALQETIQSILQGERH